MTLKKSSPDAPKPTAPATAPRIHDVAHPSKLPAADATTRPIIVSNRTVLRDPMVTAKPDTTPPLKSSNHERTITSTPQIAAAAVAVVSTTSVDTDADGISGPDKPVKPTPPVTTPAESSDTTTAVSAKTKPHITPTGDIVDEPIVADAPDPKPDATSEAKASEEVAQTESNDEDSTGLETKVAQDEAALAAEAKLQDELDGLVEKKEYFLPINAVEKRRSQQVFIVGAVLIIILGLAWLNVALDAGFVSIPGLHPVTHLFTTK